MNRKQSARDIYHDLCKLFSPMVPSMELLQIGHTFVEFDTDPKWFGVEARARILITEEGLRLCTYRRVANGCEGVMRPVQPAFDFEADRFTFKVVDGSIPRDVFGAQLPGFLVENSTVRHCVLGRAKDWMVTA